MISRRALTAGIVAIPTGILGGLLVRNWTRESASIRFIGRRNSILALLDTGNSRAMFCLGQPDTDVIANLPQLRTFGKDRVDVVIASHKWLTTTGFREAIDIDETSTISLQADESPGTIVGNVTPVSDDRQIKLDENTTADIQIVRSINDDANDPGVLIQISCNGSKIDLANNASSLEGLFENPDLLAVPGEVDADQIVGHSPAIFVSTALHTDLAIDEYLVFLDESIAFTIADGQLALQET
ncbi:MAG: hypothetical protein K5924_12850 [Chloroflexi bacterium]|nr:hypothetical protein [Chloroflexota bacterium]